MSRDIPGMLTDGQMDTLRDCVASFDPESDDPRCLLMCSGLSPYDLAVALLALVDDRGPA